MIHPLYQVKFSVSYNSDFLGAKVRICFKEVEHHSTNSENLGVAWRVNRYFFSHWARLKVTSIFGYHIDLCLYGSCCGNLPDSRDFSGVSVYGDHNLAIGHGAVHIGDRMARAKETCI